MIEELRAVIEAARAARREVRETGEEESPERTVALWSAVDALEATLAGAESNKPTGFVITRPWSLVPAGWFVRVPSGDWFEVMDTALVEKKQWVTLRSPAHATGRFPRDPDGEVSVRRGTQSKAITDAIEALSDVFGGVSIIEDKPPWDE